MTKHIDTFKCGGGNDESDMVLPEFLKGESFVVQRLAAQIDTLLWQADTLTSAFSMSVDLQRNLLQQLEDQTHQHSCWQDTNAHSILPPTPAAHTLTCHTDQLNSQTPAVNAAHLPGLVPLKFDGGKLLDPEELL